MRHGSRERSQDFCEHEVLRADFGFCCSLDSWQPHSSQAWVSLCLSPHGINPRTVYPHTCLAMEVLTQRERRHLILCVSLGPLFLWLTSSFNGQWKEAKMQFREFSNDFLLPMNLFIYIIHIIYIYNLGQSPL